MKTAATVVSTPPARRTLQAPERPSTGVGHWFRSLGLMMRFDAGRAREWAAMMAVIQVMMGAGMAFMYGFFYPVVTPTIALFIVTGTPTLALIPLGLVMVPTGVSQQKVEGTFDFIWSLPTPRSAQAASTFLLYTVLSIPGMVVAVVISAWKYGVTLSVSPSIVPAVLLSSLMAISVGFGMALAIKSPIVVNLITNTLVFVVLLFSPIVFPASHLPPWLMDVHRFLPFYAMAQVVRAGLTSGIVTDVAHWYGVLIVWTLIGWGLTAWVVGRRR
jgi:ABC-2 type transport system permease protein